MAIELSLLNCDYQKKYHKLFQENRLYQSPWMLIKFLVGLIYNLLIYVFAMHDPTDKDIVDYIENTTLSLLVRSGPNGNFLRIRNCKLATSTTFLRNFDLRYRKDDRGHVSELTLNLNGNTITSRNVIMEVLFIYHTVSCHTKLHLYSNSLTEFIIDNNIDYLSLIHI